MIDPVDKDYIIGFISSKVIPSVLTKLVLYWVTINIKQSINTNYQEESKVEIINPINLFIGFFDFSIQGNSAFTCCRNAYIRL